MKTETRIYKKQDTVTARVEVGSKLFRECSAKTRKIGLTALGLLVLTLAAFPSAVRPLPVAFASHGNEHWGGTWGTALHAPELFPGVPGSPSFENTTLRQIVHSSIGGDRVRVKLSTFGAGALAIGAAHIALRDNNAAIVPTSDRTLTFGGQEGITIPPGTTVISDPVELEVPALSDLAVSIFVPGTSGPGTWHFEALQTSYVSPPGDFSATTVMPVDRTTRYVDSMGNEHDAWFWLAGVEVTASRQTGAIVTFGDSVTDGTRSTPDSNERWPDVLAQRIVTQPGNHKLGVLNAGIAGNKLLNDILGPSGLSRFDRDVLTQTGVTHVIVLMGNNDILFVFSPADFVSVDQIIGGHLQLVRRAHARGLKIYGGTLTPFEGFFFSTPEKEAMRQAVNEWMRTSGEYDAVIDFDEVVRDPGFPTRLLPMYDSGDHLHPNSMGYEAMGNAIDLKLFKNGKGRSVRHPEL